jgi:hypothetical protein
MLDAMLVPMIVAALLPPVMAEYQCVTKGDPIHQLDENHSNSKNEHRAPFVAGMLSVHM